MRFYWIELSKNTASTYYIGPSELLFIYNGSRKKKKKKYKIQRKIFLYLSFPILFTKKMKFIFAAIYAVTALVVSGQNAGPVYITSPLTGTVYTAGKPAVMNW